MNTVSTNIRSMDGELALVQIDADKDFVRHDQSPLQKKKTLTQSRTSDYTTSAANKHHGFTLVELLVVIAIISVLASMLLPVLSEAVRTARIAACMNNQKQLYLAITLYRGDHRDLLPPPPNYFDGGGTGQQMNFMFRYNSGWSPRTQLAWGGNVMHGGYADDVHLFLCSGTDGVNRSTVDSHFNKILSIPWREWPSAWNCGGWGNYSLPRSGRFRKAYPNGPQLLLVEAVCAFTEPRKPDITRMHGAWPDDIDAYNGTHTVGLGAMNMTVTDGSVRTVRNWGNEFLYPWHLRDYYWPSNDRRSWGFWKVFNTELCGRYDG